MIRIDNKDRILPVNQTDTRGEGTVTDEPLDCDREAANFRNFISQVLVLWLTQIRTRSTASQDTSMLIVGRIGAPSVDNTSQDNQCITSVELGIHDAAIICGRRLAIVIPEVASGNDACSAIATVTLVTGSKESQAPVPSQTVFLYFSVVALMD
jgi:hypothetical protein